MADANTKKNVPASDRSYHWGMEETALFIAFIFSILGIGITNFRPQESFRYWGVMTVILALSAAIIAWAEAKRKGGSVRSALMEQAIHWVATALAVIGIFLLLGMGRLNYENTGLVLLLLLGLATFLDGYRISWSLATVGIMIFASGLIGGYIEQYVWIALIMIICVFVVIILLEKYRRAALVAGQEKVSQDNVSEGEKP